MQNKLDDINIRSLKQLMQPIDLMEEFPLNEVAVQTVLRARREAKDIIKGRDNRLLVIVGPCSIHSYSSAIEYGKLLLPAIKKYRDSLCIIMRTYFEKPRTSIGWKGLINDPHLDGSFDVNYGLRLSRKLLLELNIMGVPTGTEFLDSIIPQYISDLISWGAIGARTTESQVHRELASGLSAPIGFKNGTNGNIDIAIDAIRAANFSHHFLGVTKSGRAAIVNTKGNDSCHIILRGASNYTNYDQASIEIAVNKLAANGLLPEVMVDCSHGNSSKNHKYQRIVIDNIANQISKGSKSILGVMIESHITAGKQAFDIGQNPVQNKSITDACISWEETKKILQDLSVAQKNK